MSHLSNIEGKTMEGKLPVARLAELPLEVVSDYEPAGDQPEAITLSLITLKQGCAIKHSWVLPDREKLIQWQRLLKRSSVLP